MRCDIHTFREKLNRDSGKWESMDEWKEEKEDDYIFYTSNCPYVGRDYGLFGVLAGVRYESKQSIPAKDLPYDVSPEVQLSSDSWNLDAHTHSYLSVRELLDKVRDLKHKIILGSIIVEYKIISEKIEEILEKFFTSKELEQSEDYRVVFWFDN